MMLSLDCQASFLAHEGKTARQCAYSTHLERNLQLKFAPLRQHLCISIFEHHPWDQKGCRACKACPAFVALKVLEVLKQRQNLKGSHSADVEWLEAFAASIKSEGVISSVPKLLYIDAVLPNSTVKQLEEAGIQHIVHWSEDHPGSQLIAVHFGHAFAVALRNPSTAVSEAFAIACHACHVHLGTKQGQAEAQQATALPSFCCTQPATLPVSNSVPLPKVDGIDLSQGVGPAVPNWDDVRLLAPHAELRLLACGQASLIQPHRLSYLGELLRALLVLEVRQLTVVSQKPTQRIPAHLPSSSTAVCCHIQTACKAEAQVVLGGPPQVLQTPALVEHALRQTLAADALSLQFKLPPPGVSLAPAQHSPDIACGTAVVDVLAVTSVWVVQVLRMICADSSNRMLAALGIVAVGCTSSSAFTQADADRFTLLSHLTSSVPESLEPILLPPSRPHPAPLGLISHNTLPLQQQPSSMSLPAERQRSGSLAATANSAGSRGRPAKQPKLSSQEPPVVTSWASSRPELSVCSPQQLLEDMRQFLQVRKGKQLQPTTFPEAILNGAQLDLNALYRTVCSRGGFAMGSGVNWAGQVFPRMANFTNTHKMTGVGNALKRHYQSLCLDYELAHPQDLTKQEAS